MGRMIFRVPLDFDGPDDPPDAFGPWPPEGDAYAVFMTTSEVPLQMSPVFATEEELIDWLTQPQHLGIGAAEITMSEAAAREFVREGSASTLWLQLDGSVVSGLEAFEPSTSHTT